MADSLGANLAGSNSHGSSALFSFFTFMSLAEGNSLDDSIARNKQVLWPTVKVNWCFWFPVQVVTFGVIQELASRVCQCGAGRLERLAIRSQQ